VLSATQDVAGEVAGEDQGDEGDRQGGNDSGGAHPVVGMPATAAVVTVVGWSTPAVSMTSIAMLHTRWCPGSCPARPERNAGTANQAAAMVKNPIQAEWGTGLAEGANIAAMPKHIATCATSTPALCPSRRARASLIKRIAPSATETTAKLPLNQDIRLSPLLGSAVRAPG
jgi:hypothetical protein